MSELEGGNPDVRFERSDVDAGALLRFGLIVVLSTVAVVLLLWRLYYVFLAQEAARQPPPPVMRMDPARMLPPPPLLQIHPADDLATFRAEEDALLRSYGWVDKDRRIARVPVDEAARIVLEQGLPAWPAPAAPPTPGGAPGRVPPAETRR